MMTQLFSNDFQLYRIYNFLNIKEYLSFMMIISISLGFILLASSTLGKKVLYRSHQILTGIAASATIYNQVSKAKDNLGS
jgi:hypothetical protein